MMTEKEKYRKYHSSPLAIKRRSERNKARRLMIKKKGRKALEGKEVDHKHVNTGGGLSNRPGNLRVVSRKTNRSRNNNDWRKTSKRNT